MYWSRKKYSKLNSIALQFVKDCESTDGLISKWEIQFGMKLGKLGLLRRW